MTIITILIVCLTLSEILPFMKFLSKSFVNINGIVQLLYTIVVSLYNVITCHYYQEYKKRKAEEKDNRIKHIVREEYNKSFSMEKQKLESTIQRIENFI